MHVTNLRKVGGSVMLTVPPVFLELLNLHPGSAVGVTLENGRLILEPQSRPRYSLDELLAACDQKADLDDREWLASPATGLELI